MRRQHIPQRTPIFLGCEGASEHGYGALLNRFARELPGVHIHIHVETLQPGAGDPLALVQRAIQRITELKRRREAFAVKAILLDRGQDGKGRAAEDLARKSGIDHLVWQEPDHEGFLLRHFPGCGQLRPPAGSSFNALRQRWPDYEKASTQVQLARHISMAQITAVCDVEPDLRAFLRALGIV